MQPRHRVETGYRLGRLETVEPSITDEPSDDRAVLLFDKCLVVLLASSLFGVGDVTAVT